MSDINGVKISQRRYSSQANQSPRGGTIRILPRLSVPCEPVIWRRNGFDRLLPRTLKRDMLRTREWS